jgi:hypothetical protein
MSGQEYLLSINVPPLLEEAVVDCLLAIEAAEGFSSFVVNAHSTDHEGLSHFPILVEPSNVFQSLKNIALND